MGPGYQTQAPGQTEPMANDPRVRLAVAMLTAWKVRDREAFEAVSAEFAGGRTEALAAVTQVLLGVIKMWSDTTDLNPDDLWEACAQASRGWDADDS